MYQRLTFFIKHLPWEALIWAGALLLLGFSSISAEHHFSLCPLYNLGFDFCPGCGLGRSISFLLHGDFKKSFNIHPLGIFAVIVLSYRIIQLTKLYFKSYGKSY
jgi:hypothetical protein